MFKIEDHLSLQHGDEIKAICKPLEALGLTYFSHVHIDEKHQFAALGMDPKFGHHYFSKEYYKFDLHMAKHINTEQIIIWDTIERAKETKAMHQDFGAHGYGHTFSIIQPTKTGTDYFHFATQLGKTSINQMNVINQDLLRKFILYFKDKVNADKQLRAVYDQKLILPETNADYYTKDQLVQSQRDEFLEQIDIHRAYLEDGSHLTLKELECLHWHALGKTAEEVAMIMGITDRTVKAHIRNLKDKLNCRNQFQLGLAYSKLKQHFEFN